MPELSLKPQISFPQVHWQRDIIRRISFVATCEICPEIGLSPRNDSYDSPNELHGPQGLCACQNYYHQTFSSRCPDTKQTISFNRVPKPLPNHSGRPRCEEFSHLGRKPKSSKDRMVVGCQSYGLGKLMLNGLLMILTNC